MKNIYLAIFALMPLFAQGQYKQMLSDGKIWKCVDTIPLISKTHYTISVDGDTIVKGQNCRVLRYTYENGHIFREFAFEEGNKLYGFIEGYNGELEPTLLLDFGLQKGDLAMYDGCQVINVDTVEVKGYKRRRLAIGIPGNGYATSYWVEGIGANNDLLLPPLERIIGEYSYIESCYENGVCIFDENDFTATVSYIEKVSTTKERKGQLYDLSGKKVNVPRRGQPCIDSSIRKVLIK